MTKFRYLIEAGLVHAFIFLFSIMPLDMASGLGGWIGRTIGSRLASNRKALRNLKLAFPEYSEAQYRNIIRGMWDNLGRTFAEYPHLEQISHERTEAIGAEYLKPIVEESKACVLFTGHIANWETPAAYARVLGIDLDLVYRAPNNPYVDRLLQKYRGLNGKLKMYPKSSQGMRDIFSALKKNRRVGILIDQKYNQGVAMPFFGHPAMTSPAFAQLAQRFDCPLHAAYAERLQGANFRLTIYPQMNTRDREINDIVTEANLLLEGWIRARPEQWLWLHRRWGKLKDES